MFYANVSYKPFHNLLNVSQLNLSYLRQADIQQLKEQSGFPLSRE